MNKRLVGWVGGILVVAGGLMAFVPMCRYLVLGLLTREPFYESRSASYWVYTVQNGDDPAREHAAHVLGKLGPEPPAGVVPKLTAALKDQDFIVRKNAALALGEIGPAAKPATEGLIGVLKDENPVVRRAAAGSLGRIRPEAQEALPALLLALKDGDVHTRVQAIGSLGQFGAAPETIPVLIEILKEPAARDASPSSAAQGALLEIGSAASPALSKVLAGQNKTIAAGALRVLGDLGAPAKQAVSGMIPLLQDSDAKVRLMAAEAVWKVDRQAQAVVPVLVEGLKNQKSWEIRGNSAFVLSQMGPEAKAAIPALIEALKDQYEDIRQLVVDALGRMGPEAKAAVPALQAALKDEEVQVRQKAAAALQKIQGEEATAARQP